MKPTLIKRIAASLLAGMVIVAAGAASAESLAGKIGDKRFSPKLSLNPKEACYKAYLSYVAAKGHSAYATTFYSRVAGIHIFCSVKLNASSQKAAEDTALRGCRTGFTRLKVQTASGGCAIAMSK